MTLNSMTRHVFYQRKNGASLRTARREFVCNQFGCFRKIVPGEQYLDTREVTTFPATKRICITCSEHPV